MSSGAAADLGNYWQRTIKRLGKGTKVVVELESGERVVGFLERLQAEHVFVREPDATVKITLSAIRALEAQRT